MTAAWTLTVDCAHPARLATFWATALGYVEKPPPWGFASWGEWLAAHDVPEEGWDDGAYLVDPWRHPGRGARAGRSRGPRRAGRRATSSASSEDGR